MRRARRRERDVPAKGCCHERTRIVIASTPDPGTGGWWAARCAVTRKDFDDDHAAAATRARRTMIGRGEIELLAFLGGELWAEDQRPVVEPLADDFRAQLVGGGLQCGDVIDREKGIVALAEPDLRTLELLLDETVAVEVVGGPEREERGDPHHHRAEGFIAQVEIVVRETAALVGENPVIWILGGVFRYGNAKGGSLLHALEDEVDAVGAFPCHASLPGQDMVFLAHALFGPFDRQPVVAGKGLHPDLVVGGTLAQDLLVDRRNADDLTEKMHHLLGPRQPAEVAVNDNAVEAMVDERKQVSEQLGEQFHGHPHKARSDAKSHQAWTGPADRGRQEFSSGR